jgi:hypothetical protein
MSTNIRDTSIIQRSLKAAKRKAGRTSPEVLLDFASNMEVVGAVNVQRKRVHKSLYAHDKHAHYFGRPSFVTNSSTCNSTSNDQPFLSGQYLHVCDVDLY